MGKMYAWHCSIVVKPKFILVLLLLVFATWSQAQNTKGDKPAPTTSPAKEGKGKLFGKMRSGNAKANSGRARVKNVFPQSGPYVNNPSKKPSKTQPSNVRLPSAHRVQRSPSHSDKATTRTIGGGRITAPRSSSGRITKVYPQRGPFVNNPSPSPKKERPTSVRLPSAVKTVRTPSGRDRAYTKGSISGARIPPRPSAKAASRNIFSQKGPYVNNPSPKPRRPDASPRNQPLHQSRRLSMSKAAAQARSMGMRGTGFKTITAQFLSRGKKDVYWGKFRKKEQAITTDIAGRKLRTLNYHSPKAGLVGRDTLPFFRRTPKVIKRGPSAPLGGYQSATRTGKAWSGDVSGTKLRRQSAKPNREKAGVSLSPGRKISVTAKGERAGKFFMPRKMSITPRGEHPGRPLHERQFAVTPNREKAGISLSPRRTISVTAKGERAGKFFMPRKMSITPKGEHTGQPLRGRQAIATRKSEKASLNSLPTKAPGLGAVAMFQFSKRAQPLRPKGVAGTSTRKTWNNGNKPLPAKSGGIGSYMAGKFQGNFKTRRPAKGGGSISGQLWNNQNQPIEVRTGGRGSRLAGLFAGNIKARRPEKGGGSVKRNLWNNDGQPMEVRTGGRGSRLAGLYAGNIKTRRPEKGGGSVSRNLWNNGGQPMEVRTGGTGSRKGGLYQGNIKVQPKPETAGKLATFQGKINQVIPGVEMSQIGLDYTGARKADSYTQSPKANKESLRKIKHPDGLALNLPILNQTKRSVNAGHYNHVMKQYWDYVKAPNSKPGALKVREPGKATARIGDLQVNVKMHKPTDAQMHPDARWANSLRDNVKAERTFLMNVRLTWAKLFKKSDYQPRNLKEKQGKPRFDPGEKDLWYK
jgi:hypothetical protein